MSTVTVLNASGLVNNVFATIYQSFLITRAIAASTRKTSTTKLLETVHWLSA